MKAALKEIGERASNAKAVNVGFLSGATYPDGTSVAMVAAIQNFGAPGAGIPPRPFFTRMIQEKSPGWGVSLGALLKGDNYDANKALDQMGEGISGQLRASIIDEDKELSPVTVMLRGMRSQGTKITGKTVGEAAERVAKGKTNYGASTKPLIDTGHMLESIDHEVTE